MKYFWITTFRKMEVISKVLSVLLLALLVISAEGAIQTRVRFKFLEEQQPGTYIGNVAIASGIRTALNDFEFSKLSFFIDELYDSTAYFKVAVKTGELTAIPKIDRERVCDGGAVCELTTEVTVYEDKDGGLDLYTILNVAVEIEDINDNDPQFPSKYVELSIPEGSSSLGYDLALAGATDKDSGIFSVDVYSIQRQTQTFGLEVRPNPDGSSYLGIVAKEELDRETRDSYQVIIVAKDGGNPARSGSVLVNITVTDINDNKPYFLQSSYNESVPENVELNVPIMTVKAKDNDIGRNAEISYRFSSQGTDEIRKIFYLDENTGELLAKSSLDYEKTKQYQFHVEAVDHGSFQFTSRVAVTLHILDVNDNAPHISINMEPERAHLSEKTKVGFFVAQITAHDEDSGLNGEVLCEIQDGYFSLEKFDVFTSNVYKVILSRPLDHERFPSHKVTITCSDNGKPPLSNSTSFIVNVIDENDNRPEFTKPTFYGQIRENLGGIHRVVNVTAHDWDDGDFGRITYSIEDKDQGLFRIDPDTGEVFITRAVDRERNASMVFHVIARDHGPEQLSASALVNITVEDENDEPPHFDKPGYFGHVLENQPRNTLVGKVVAEDADIGANAETRYSILPMGEDYFHFSINERTGEIKSSMVFDREEKDHYYIVIQAQDVMKPEFTSTCNFTVTVLDDNDHPPKIHMDVADNGTVVLESVSKVGQEIIQIYASDGDDPTSRNSELSFYIKSGDPDQLFNLNRFSGLLSLARIITVSDIKVHHLVIKVEDGADPPKVDTKSLNIRINGTIPSSGSGGLDDNILIVIILIGVTIVLALAIVLTICLIKKIDRERRANKAKQKNSEEKMYQIKQQEMFSNMTPVDGMEDTNSNNLSKKNGGGKKEVSFSLDEESDSHNTSAGSGHPLTSFKANTDTINQNGQVRHAGPSSKSMGNGGMNIPVVGLTDKPNITRRSPRDEECHLIEILKQSAEDAHSQSSGETDPSDSGRGGSEDDSSHRGSGVDREHNNNKNNSTSALYPQVFYRGSPTESNEHPSHHPHHNQRSPYHQQSLHPPKPMPKPGRGLSRQTSNNSSQQLSSPRNSLTSDFGSDVSGSRTTSQSRTDSNRSTTSLIRSPQHRNDHRGDPRGRPPLPPSGSTSSNSGGIGHQHTRPNSTSPTAQMLPFRSRDLYPNMNLITQDSPNRLAGPPYHTNSLLRSFHGNPSGNSFHLTHPSQSISMERLPNLESDRSFTPSSYSDRSYPGPGGRWAPHSSFPEEDDRTTTSGSYTINPDELRQEIDELILHDSIV